MIAPRRLVSVTTSLFLIVPFLAAHGMTEASIATTTTTTTTSSSTCGAVGSDRTERQCDAESDVDDEGGGTSRAAAEGEGGGGTSTNDAESASSGGGGGRARRHRRGGGRDVVVGDVDARHDDYGGSTADDASHYRPRFRKGDIVELYNPESRDVQIVFPSIVQGYDHRPAPASSQEDDDGGGEGKGGYRVTKTTDGREISGLHERYVHAYAPYEIGDEALCNIGTYPGGVRGAGNGGEGGGGGPIIVRCTVNGYEPAATRGALILQGSYMVHVHATRANEGYDTTLPVWKLQRRYLAK